MSLTKQTLSDDQLRELLSSAGLPGSFFSQVKNNYVELMEWVKSRKLKGQCLVVGINGAQGSGKSTLAQFMAAYSEANYSWNSIAVSIDDLYLTKKERCALAETIHPLFNTRGVPGTHDIDMGVELLKALTRQTGIEQTSVVRFDKVTDDRKLLGEWDFAEGKVDLVILEGWCVGSIPQSEAALSRPLNCFEKTFDGDGVWRRYSNSKLAEEYPRLFGFLDCLIFLEVPDMQTVIEWRSEQEVANLYGVGGGAKSLSREQRQQIENFVQHFERLTKHNKDILPNLCDVHVMLDANREVIKMKYQ